MTRDIKATVEELERLKSAYQSKVLANGETVSPLDNQIEYLYRNFYLPAMKGMLAKHAQEHKEKYPWIPD